MIIQKQFFYVRHGETDWNRARKLQGSSNIPLNETGIAQAHTAKAKLAGSKISRIFCSPLQRARKTADIINEVLNCQIEEIPDLREWHFGSSEGSPYFDWLHELFNGDTSNVPGDVEPLENFMARTTDAINYALEHDGPILIVAHGGTYVPARNCLPPNQRESLKNCLPVRHDPPTEKNGEWNREVL